VYKEQALSIRSCERTKAWIEQITVVYSGTPTQRAGLYSPTVPVGRNTQVIIALEPQGFSSSIRLVSVNPVRPTIGRRRLREIFLCSFRHSAKHKLGFVSSKKAIGAIPAAANTSDRKGLPRVIHFMPEALLVAACQLACCFFSALTALICFLLVPRT